MYLPADPSISCTGSTKGGNSTDALISSQRRADIFDGDQLDLARDYSLSYHHKPSSCVSAERAGIESKV